VDRHPEVSEEIQVDYAAPARPAAGMAASSSEAACCFGCACWRNRPG